jgi:SAM-dependent methyltransferase
MKPVSEYYAEIAKDYREAWYPKASDATGDHSNYVRLWPVLRSLARRFPIAIHASVYEVGCGDGYVLRLLHSAGYHVLGGCDTSDAMLAQIPEDFVARDGDLRWADLEDATTLAPMLAQPRPDAILCLGVLPHVSDDRRALENLRMLGQPGTVYYLEVRNALFSLFSMNRYTAEFIVNELLGGVAWETNIRQNVGVVLNEMLRITEPPPEPTTRRFHNPLSLPGLLKECGFGVPQFHYYHAHATLPWLGNHDDPEIKKAMVALEQPHDWRSMFLCSAVIVEVEAV